MVVAVEVSSGVEETFEALDVLDVLGIHDVEIVDEDIRVALKIRAIIGSGRVHAAVTGVAWMSHQEAAELVPTEMYETFRLAVVQAEISDERTSWVCGHGQGFDHVAVPDGQPCPLCGRHDGPWNTASRR